MSRSWRYSWLAIVLAGLGCAGTWDKVSSRQFRDNPFKTMVGSGDEPMEVLRKSSIGSERADAFRRLKEPAASGREAEQQEALQYLEPAATLDPSPVVRTAAIDALSRFKDPRAVPILINAYQNADGRVTKVTAPTAQKRPEQVAAQPNEVMQTSLRNNLDPLGIGAPIGFAPEFTRAVRMQVVQALAATGHAEAGQFLARIAMSESGREGEAPEERDVRVAAVRGLSQVRQKDSVVALTKVLEKENGKDLVMVSRAHEGLTNLTGKSLPPAPDAWNGLVQAGFEIAPEPSAIQRALHSVVP